MKPSCFNLLITNSIKQIVREKRERYIEMGEITQGEPILEAWNNKEIEEQEEEAQAQIEIWKYIFGYVELAVIKCAIELGIADAIESHGSPMTLSQLSSALASDPSLLNRILRFLINRKIFKPIKKDSDSNTTYYANTALSRRLAKRGQQSMASFLLLESSPVMLAPWHSLSARVSASNGGITNFPFEKAHGEDVWRFAAENLGHSNLINEAMACSAKIVVPAIVEGCGDEVFGGVKTVVDVGGGNGTAMRVLVKACPWIGGINFDLAHVIAVAPESEGVQNVAGDMFLAVPKADAAFIMWVLHDWGDEECIQILKNCREAIPKENGKVIIVEAVIEEGANNNKLKDVGLMLDMVMMAHTSLGKERTLKEWEYVIKMAGFTSYTVKDIDAVQSVILAFP